jgi:hypothetical protein
MLILGNNLMSWIQIVISLDPNVFTTGIKYQEMCGEETFPMVQVLGQNSFWKRRNQRNCVLEEVIVLLWLSVFYCVGDGDEAPTYLTGIHWHAYVLWCEMTYNGDDFFR